MNPIVYTTSEELSIREGLSALIQKETNNQDAGLLLSYPVVYIHFWPGKPIEYTRKDGTVISKNRFNVYVGESNDIIQRTKDHYLAGADPQNWQSRLLQNQSISSIVVIAHPHFNKSFTLDLENRLIEYISPGNNIEELFNARGNPQNGYYPVEEFEGVFHSVWRQLRKVNNDLFLSLSEIEKTAFFKASPLKKLTSEQLDAKEEILTKIFEALDNGKEGQLIFVQGEAGTGKTVLNSAIFYELITKTEGNINCHLLVNHNQQLSVYQQIVARLNLGKGIVHKPTSFILKHSPKNKVDVTFVDEGHLLLTRGKQSYTGHNQLEDIINRSRVTVIMFDEFQVLTAEEYWEPAVLDRFKNIAFKQRNLLYLSKQLRMHCAESTLRWINSFVEYRKILHFNDDDKNYELKSFDSPGQLQEAILARSKTDSLSRIIATYDWPYNEQKAPEEEESWSVHIGNWALPWNYELEKTLSPKERRLIKGQAWAEQVHTINEVGSTFTIQGFDLAYAGVILGPSVRYINNEVVFDPSKSFNKKAKEKRTLMDGSKVSYGETFIRNEVKVLLTRGVKGLYIYACDKALRDALKNIAQI